MNRTVGSVMAHVADAAMRGMGNVRAWRVGR